MGACPRYLFNPYSIAACIGQSTALVANLAVLLALYCGQTGASPSGCAQPVCPPAADSLPVGVWAPIDHGGRVKLPGAPIVGTVMVAVAAYASIYPVVLVLPLAAFFGGPPARALAKAGTVLGLTGAGLLQTSAYMAGGWAFWDAVYVFGCGPRRSVHCVRLPCSQPNDTDAARGGAVAWWWCVCGGAQLPPNVQRACAGPCAQRWLGVVLFHGDL